MKNTARIAAATLLVAISTTRADTLWRQYGFNAAHTSNNSSEHILNPSNVSQLALVWKSNTLLDFGSAGPVLGFDALFFGIGDVRAIEKRTGTERWAQRTCSRKLPAQPAFGRGVVLVGDAGGDLAAYDPATGNVVWCNALGGSIVSGAALAGDTAFVTNGEAAIAVDQSTGELRWTYPALANLGIHVANTPAIANGVVFITGEGSIVALDGITGRKIWRTQIQATYFIISAASVADGVVYVGGFDGIFALSATDGHMIWKNNFPTNATTPAIADGRVFTNSEDPGLFAFDAVTGAFLWQNGLPGESRNTVTVANDVVYDIAEADTGDPKTHGRLFMFDAASGRLLKRLRDPGGEDFGFQPVVANGTVYVATGDHVDAFALP